MTKISVVVGPKPANADKQRLAAEAKMDVAAKEADEKLQKELNEKHGTKVVKDFKIRTEGSYHRVLLQELVVRFDDGTELTVKAEGKPAAAMGVDFDIPILVIE